MYHDTSPPLRYLLQRLDMPEVVDKQEQLLAELRASMPHSRLLAVSAAGRQGLEELVLRTYQFLGKVRRDEEERKERDTAEEEQLRAGGD